MFIPKKMKMMLSQTLQLPGIVFTLVWAEAADPAAAAASVPFSFSICSFEIA